MFIICVHNFVLKYFVHEAQIMKLYFRMVDVFKVINAYLHAGVSIVLRLVVRATFHSR